jgi:hypothetical protein
MQRRDFLTVSAVGAAAVASRTQLARAQAAGAPRQYIEWRTYRVNDADKQAIVGNYLQSAAVPAWQRMGLGPVGAFKEIGEGAGQSLHVMLAHPTLEAFAKERTTLEADGDYQKNAVDYYAAAMSDPAFERIDSWLTIAFAGMPVPAPPQKDSRVYELRTYESHSEERARKKVEMFDKYEITIFPQCGFENVFFGEALIGSGLPCLKYMLAAPDMAANEEGWRQFINHPDWLAVRDLPEYKDTVSKITRLYLEALPFSQV